MSTAKSISVVIPSYNRGSVLLQTLQQLFSQDVPANEIIVVDQTHYPDNDAIAEKLSKFQSDQKITWLRLHQPSIPCAMNRGLLSAGSDYVLFIDDDVEFERDFISQHICAIEQYAAVAHVGQIVQPWQQAETYENYQPGSGFLRDLHFPFNSENSVEIANCMAGNLCVQRAAAIAAGGFDENFDGAAYRFESEFCRRLIRHSGSLFRFAPLAALNHLHVSTGGTRSIAHHLTSASGSHSMGDYYFAFLETRGLVRWKYILRRCLGSVISRFYLRAPWYIPVRILAETRGFYSAARAFARGQKTLDGAAQPALPQPSR
ncbi:MAG: glycosyltransferase [Arenicella sp.]|nr:glycosyltransferase [Arenicella sp.]